MREDNYFKTIFMIDRLQVCFIDALKAELERMNIKDINKVQCFILYNIGIDKITCNDMIKRGYYLGTNVCYNLRSMVKNGYVIKYKQSSDSRSTYVKLTDKGLNLHKILQELFDTHEKNLSQESDGVNKKMMNQLGEIFSRLENFWEEMARYDMQF